MSHFGVKQNAIGGAEKIPRGVRPGRYSELFVYARGAVNFPGVKTRPLAPVWPLRLLIL